MPTGCPFFQKELSSITRDQSTRLSAQIPAKSILKISCVAPGARANASIGAGSAASGGVGVSNMAEGYGNALGNSVVADNAAISFTPTGTGQALSVNFTDLYS